MKTFRTVAQVPSITSARILNYDLERKNLNPITIYSRWSQRCLERGKSIKFQQTYLVDTSSKDVISLIPTDSSSEQVIFLYILQSDIFKYVL